MAQYFKMPTNPVIPSYPYKITYISKKSDLKSKITVQIIKTITECINLFI